MRPLDPRDPHRGQAVATAGRPLEEAGGAVVMLHGRGATAGDILSLASELGRPDLAYLAPQAAGFTWYPYSFLAPLAQNEPWLSSALRAVGEVLERVAAAGVPAERTVLLGFSQGACLTLEYAARHARRYAGVVGFSGGLIGPPGAPRDDSLDDRGSLDGTPVFLGCSDRDPHVPRERVDETARVLAALGAEVTERIYPAMGHTINQEEIDFARRILAGLPGPAPATPA